MIKKLALCAMIAAMVFALTGCNQQIGFDTMRSFEEAYIALPNGTIINGAVDSWRDFEQSDTIQITINGTTYLTHYSNVVLVHNARSGQD